MAWNHHDNSACLSDERFSDRRTASESGTGGSAFFTGRFSADERLFADTYYFLPASSDRDLAGSGSYGSRTFSDNISDFSILSVEGKILSGSSSRA